MRITFLGAAGTVTGSKYLIDFNQYRILIDCGLFQGLKELRLRNWDQFPIDPKSIDIILLTHAHIDHSGYLPLLVKNGFTGDIISTKATQDLCRVLLPDSGYLHEEDAKRANKYHYSKHHPALPLYTQEDGINCLKYFKPIEFNQTIALFPKINACFRQAGHILGAAFIELTLNEETITFSGDLGRFNDPIMNPPSKPNKCKTLVIESTYGNRLHEEEDPSIIIGKTINDTIHQQGTILIPAFAVGRTQSIMYYLDHLIINKKIPNIPIYLDSPMAIDATKILQKYLTEHQLSKSECSRICSRVEYINSPEESKILDTKNFPKIIISASGMLSGGRILHHLKCFGTNSKNTILMTGFQAVGTRGARLLNHEPQLKIHGEMVPIKAKVVELSSTSAHADYSELIKWLSLFPTLPSKIFITHGEPESALALKKHIADKFHINATIPKYLESDSW